MRIAFVYLNTEKCVNQGVGYVASVILDAGYDLTFFDTAYELVLSIAGKVIAGSYDLLIMSAATTASRQAFSLAKRVKESLPDLPILLGGVHATVLQGKVLEACSEIDYLCVGEGEEFILEFLSKIGSSDIISVPNLVYRDNGIVCNPLRPPMDLEKLPRFRYEIFDPFSVVQPYPMPGFCYVYATRGCPYSCTYCCNSCYLELYRGNAKGYLRMKSVDYVIDDLLYLKANYPVQFFFFGDDMVVFNEEFVTELFHRISSDVKLPYGCMARVERITPSIVELFRETGCGYVGMGVECGNEEFRRKFLNRHMTNEQIVEAFKRLRTIPGIKLCSYNMEGYPVPNDAELKTETLEFNMILSPDIIQITTFFPFPGTKLYDYCVEHDLIDYEKMELQQEWFHQSILKTSS